MIVPIGEKVLLKRCTPVKLPPSEEVQKLVAVLLTVMWEHKGYGLAANQIGRTERVAVVDAGNGMPLVLINPKILQHGHTKVMEEGCLSIPGENFKRKRWTWVVIQAYTDTGEKYRLGVRGITAQAIQHELDHLNGRLCCRPD